MSNVAFYSITSSQYSTMTKVDNALYFLTDTGQLYKGTVLFGGGGGSGDGHSSYVYIGYAENSSGDGFSTTPSPNRKYISFLISDTEISSPGASDFSNWMKYIGDDGSGGGSSFDPSDYYTKNDVDTALFGISDELGALDTRVEALEQGGGGGGGDESGSGEGGFSITIDKNLDAESHNAVENSAIAVAIEDVEDRVDNLESGTSTWTSEFDEMDENGYANFSDTNSPIIGVRNGTSGNYYAIEKNDCLIGDDIVKLKMETYLEYEKNIDVSSSEDSSSSSSSSGGATNIGTWTAYFSGGSVRYPALQEAIPESGDELEVFPGGVFNWNVGNAMMATVTATGMRVGKAGSATIVITRSNAIPEEESSSSDGEPEESSSSSESEAALPVIHFGDGFSNSYDIEYSGTVIVTILFNGLTATAFRIY